MADFTPKKIEDISQLNNGKEYVNGVDVVDADDLNKVVESQLWIQKLGENPVSVNGITGTPSARIGTMPDGTPHLVLNNIQGTAGRGIISVTASQDEEAKYTICTFTFTDGTTTQVGIPSGKNGTAVMTTKSNFDVGTTQIPFMSINIPQSRNGEVLVGDLLLTPDGMMYRVKSKDTLWAYVKEEFSIKGAKGVGIATSVITYAVSTSGTTPPTSGWYEAIPSVAQGSYLWTRTVITYTNNASSTSYSIARQGADGSGASIHLYEHVIRYNIAGGGDPYRLNCYFTLITQSASPITSAGSLHSYMSSEAVYSATGDVYLSKSKGILVGVKGGGVPQLTVTYMTDWNTFKTYTAPSNATTNITDSVRTII